MNITDIHMEQFIEAAHEAGANKLMLCSSGNLSWRIDDYTLVSGTGSWLPKIRKEQLSICNITTGEVYNGVKPSMESTFHLAVLRERKDMNVVLHCQSEYATVVACMKNRPTNFNVTAEVPCYNGSEIGVVPYFRPGSPELAKAVTEVMKNHDTALLVNHGQVVVGKDFDDALQRAIFFEMACAIIVRSGMQYNTLNEKDIADLDYYIKGKTSK